MSVSVGPGWSIGAGWSIGPGVLLGTAGPLAGSLSRFCIDKNTNNYN
jgi:hypothetical protein